ncbi:GNAT family N-acetyltransferase [Ornithinimicrobium sp. Y1847]|uniref:GNAT family N-acetyltransferase n=1 Tax=unclassified Ornithinimicrobium TaxID=2615080 RepID=UPI003B677985
MDTPPPPQVIDAVRRLRARLPRHTGRCVLREATTADGEAVHAYRSLPEVALYLGHPPLSREASVEWLSRKLDNPTAVSVAIVVDDTLIGDVLAWVRPCAAKAPAVTEEVEAGIGYAVHPSWQGRGLASEAVEAVVDLLVTEVGVRRITSRVFAPAAASSRLLERIGFVREGIERQSMLAPDGQTWWDDEWWSLLRPGRPGRAVAAPEPVRRLL